MRATGMLCALVPCLVLPLGMVSLSGGGPLPISEEAAIREYSKVAKTLRIALGGEKPTVSEVEARISEWATRVGSVRKVRSRDLSVDVDAYSGKIVRVRNEAAWERSYVRAETAREEGKGIGPTRSPKQIIDAAENYCRALGQNLTPDLRLRIMEFDDKQARWGLGWFRYINGYVFDEEGISIHIEDQTGDLVLYSNGVTEIACNTEVRVPKDKARAIARNQVSKILPNLVGNQPFNFDEVEEPELWIVYVNDLLKRAEASAPPEQLLPSPQELPPRARLVYAIRFEFYYVGKERVHRSRGPVTVWVDAGNGKIVGGIL
ncbi:MAG: hypothetical protein WBC53_09845 [Phycisphaerae bacterium]